MFRRYFVINCRSFMCKCRTIDPNHLDLYRDGGFDGGHAYFFVLLAEDTDFKKPDGFVIQTLYSIIIDDYLSCVIFFPLTTKSSRSLDPVGYIQCFPMYLFHL